MITKEDISVSVLRSILSVLVKLTDLSYKPLKPVVINVPVSAADTETPCPLPTGVKKISVKARGGEIHFCFAKGNSGIAYVMLADGVMWYESDINYSDGYLYFQSPTAGATIEVIVWL